MCKSRIIGPALVLLAIGLSGCVTDERQGGTLGQQIGSSLGMTFAQMTGRPEASLAMVQLVGQLGSLVGQNLARALNEPEQKAVAAATGRALARSAPAGSSAGTADRDRSASKPPTASAPTARRSVPERRAPARDSADTTGRDRSAASRPPETSAPTAKSPAPERRAPAGRRAPLPKQKPEHWQSPTDPDVKGTVTVVDQSVDDGRLCRITDQVGYVHGKEIRDQVKYCQRADGGWEPVPA